MNLPAISVAAFVLAAATLPASRGLAQDVARMLSLAVDADPIAYPAARARLLRAGSRALPLLRREAVAARAARRRGLAAAIAARIESPSSAIALDRWQPAPRLRMLHNPHPAMTAALARAYAQQPALAFERLATRRDVGGWEVEALARVIAGGPDARARLSHLLAAHPGVAATLSRLAGSGPALRAALARTGETETETQTMLATALGRQPSVESRARLRELFSSAREDDVRTAAARSLGQLRDPDAVELLVASLAEPDQHDGQGTRREVTIEALVAILGADGLFDRFVRMASEARAERRRIAAFGLGWERGRPAEAAARLALLSGDADETVVLQALSSLAWLCIRQDASATVAFDASVEAAVTNALASPSEPVRIAAFEALGRLTATGRLRPRTDAHRQLAIRIALADPSERARGAALWSLSSFVGDGDATAILAMLGDLGELGAQSILERNYQQSREAWRATLTPDRLRTLRARRVPELSALIGRWRGR